jgi:hypothetical protein
MALRRRQVNVWNNSTRSVEKFHAAPSPVFVIKLRARPGDDGIRSLRAILKTLLRRHRLVCVDAREERAA